VGDVFSQNVQSAEGKTYPMSIISYYDKVEDFKFNANQRTYSWAMPFNWNISRIQNAPNMFVHEEVRVPKAWAGVGDANTFDAKVNGKPIAGRMLAIDPFSDENNLILHFLINKNDILDMAKNNPPADGKMAFSFSPQSAASSGQQTSGEISTDTGGVHVLLNWTPDQLKAGAETKLNMQFVDAFAGTNITDDVKYDLKVFDNAGKEVFTKADQTAKGGAGEQTLNFPADASYRVEVAVKGLVKEGQAPDLTRNGVARGTVVVPEFPAGAMVAVAGALAAVVVAQRLMAQKKTGK
jgi:hypothetical protein